jgi:lipopolysaccharide biosynthesis glycosyltransferase
MGKHQVICATDDDYVLPFLVMLQSAKLNSQEDFSITIGYDSNALSQENKRIISIVLRIIEVDFRFTELEITEDMAQRGHISGTSYARLILADRSDGVVLWLDADLICLPNWDTIFSESMDIENKNLISVVRDSGITEELISKTNNESLRFAGLNYFNSGVLVFTCDNWRKLEFQKKWPAILKQANELGFQWADQCALNYICRENINYLASDYNVLAGSRKHRLRSKPYILHFAGGSKPWFYSIFNPQIFIGILYPKDVYRYLAYQGKLIRAVHKQDKIVASNLRNKRLLIRRKVQHPRFRSALIRLIHNIGQIK